MSNLKITGGRELIKNLHLLEQRVRARVMKKAMRKALAPASKLAKQNVPRKSGALKKAIGVDIKYVSEHYVEAAVSVRRGKRYPAGRYGWMVERGTIKTRAKPFLEPAFEQTKEQALERLNEELANEIDKVL